MLWEMHARIICLLAILQTKKVFSLLWCLYTTIQVNFYILELVRKWVDSWAAGKSICWIVTCLKNYYLSYTQQIRSKIDEAASRLLGFESRPHWVFSITSVNVVSDITERGIIQFHEGPTPMEPQGLDLWFHKNHSYEINAMLEGKAI